MTLEIFTNTFFLVGSNYCQRTRTNIGSTLSTTVISSYEREVFIDIGKKLNSRLLFELIGYDYFVPLCISCLNITRTVLESDLNAQ